MLLRGPWIVSSQELLAMTASEMDQFGIEAFILGRLLRVGWNRALSNQRSFFEVDLALSIDGLISPSCQPVRALLHICVRVDLSPRGRSIRLTRIPIDPCECDSGQPMLSRRPVGKRAEAGGLFPDVAPPSTAGWQRGMTRVEHVR